jgi:prevent-host-death family protein
MNMELNATEAKREFGDLLLKAQKEPVNIVRNGKRVAAVISNDEFEQYEAYKLMRLKQEIDAGLADVEKGQLHDGADVMAALIKRVSES